MNVEVLLGKTMEHLVPLEGTKFFVHQQMRTDLLRLQKDAREAGLELEVASAFRDHARQTNIWNMKARGERPVLDDRGNPLDPALLSPRELMFAILRWSALPGCSRHHWGTDIDVFDRRKQGPDDVKLVPSECEGDGPAAALHSWLDSRIDQGTSHGFYRPYRTDRGGVAPERWHLSYWPISRRLTDYYTFSIFKRNIEDSDLLLKAELLENAFEVYERFFLNVDLP